MVQRFLVWSADLPTVENIKIPRIYFTGAFDNIELHMFGDSFQDIFKAVAFLRAREKTPTGKVKTVYRKYSRIAAHVGGVSPKHSHYRNPDDSITDPTELDEAERHIKYLVQ